jgi:beta-lactamase class A
MNTMDWRIARRLAVVLAVVVGSMGFPPGAAGGTRYQVSYLWHGNLESVQDYRDKVARVLGKAVAKDLEVVSKGGLYGLIYVRNGDSAGAARVAKVHTRLLRRAGLNAAAPMKDGGWTVLGATAEPNRPAAAAPPVPALRPAKKAEAPEKKTEAPKAKAKASDLEAAVEAYIKSLRRQGRIVADERTSWSVYDFTTGEKLVSINEDIQLQAASLIKPFIAAAFFHRVKTGGLVYGPKSRSHMQRMIQHSSNRSANWVMRQVGGPKSVQRILHSAYPGIFEDTRIVEYIPNGGRTYRNKASAHDYSRFLYALWNDQIAGAREIRRLMALPGPDRIFDGARHVPNGTKVYNKTGSTARLCGDMGILVVKGPDGRSYPYTIVGLIEKRNRARNYSTWIRTRGDVIRNVSNIVYDGIVNRHGSGGGA